MTTPVRPVLQRVILDYFQKQMNGQRTARAAVYLDKDLTADIAVMLQPFAGCFFVTLDRGEKVELALCQASEVASALNRAVTALGVTSLIFADGGLTFSADMSHDGRNCEVDLVAWGRVEGALSPLVEARGSKLHPPPT